MKAQVSFEYVIIMGFVVFAIIGIMTVALIYSLNIRDRIKNNEIEGCIDKIVTTAESVYYSGKPSRATIKCFMPEGIDLVNITSKEIILYRQSSSGVNIRSFPSNVPLYEKNFTLVGVRRIKIEALDNNVNITLI